MSDNENSYTKEKIILDFILRKYGKKTTEANRNLLVKYSKIFSNISVKSNSKHCTESVFYQFLETHLDKFEN